MPEHSGNWTAWGELGRGLRGLEAVFEQVGEALRPFYVMHMAPKNHAPQASWRRPHNPPRRRAAHTRKP